MPRGWKPGRHSWELINVTKGPMGGVVREYRCRLCGKAGNSHQWSRGRMGWCYAQQSINFNDPTRPHWDTAKRPHEPVEWTTDDEGHVVWL